MLKIILILVTFTSCFADTLEQLTEKEFSKFDQVLDKKYYKICYNYSYNGATAVSYTLPKTTDTLNDIKKRPYLLS